MIARALGFDLFSDTLRLMDDDGDVIMMVMTTMTTMPIVSKCLEYDQVAMVTCLKYEKLQ